MNTQFFLDFSDQSVNYHLQLKQVDYHANNTITIADKNYRVKGTDEAIKQLKSHLKVNKFENVSQLKASLQKDLGAGNHVSVVFQRVINKRNQPTVDSTHVEVGHAPCKTEVEAIHAIQNKLMALDGENAFSGTLIVTKFGNRGPLIASAVGFANMELNQKNGLETRYNIASIGKIFTTVAVLQLVEQGKLSLDDPIGKYLPEITNEKMKKVTVSQLLTHTGGTGDIEGPFREISHYRKYIEISKDRAPSFVPGNDYQYSNYGFVLLGAVIEKVAQKDYYEYVQEKIFDVAGMQSSSFPEKTVLPSDAAVGYITTDTKFLDNQDVLPLGGLPSGLGYSTGPDLVRFSNALLEGKLLHHPSSLDLVMKSRPVTNDKKHPTTHSMGFMTGDHWFGHSGHYDGVNGEVRIYPQTGYIVVALANRDQEAASNLAQFIDETLPKNLP